MFIKSEKLRLLIVHGMDNLHNRLTSDLGKKNEIF